MARVTTKTGIANLTASLLKVEAVTNIDPPAPNSKFAKLANRWYDEIRRSCLAEAIWDFAVKRAILPADSVAPIFGRANKFLLPADYIRIATINDETLPETDYEIEDGYLLCDLPAPINLRYVFDQEQILKFSPKFVALFAAALAKATAYDMTGNRSMVEEMRQEYMMILSDGRSIEAQSNPPKRVQRSKWAASRQRGHVGRYQ
jgi:hypothetical protein